MRLRRGTSEILNLSGGSGTIRGCQYLDAAADGEAETVTETIEVVLEGTAAAVLADVETIERWLEEARLYQENETGERVWLEMDLLDTGDWWRSEALRGMVSRGTSMRMLLGGTVKIGAQVTRRNWWETLNEVSVPLSNGNGTNVTTGINVYNASDGVGVSPNVRHNYAHIGADVILGTLPAPAKLEMTSIYTSASNLAYVWVAQNFSSDPANLAHVLEAEAATGGTLIAGGDASGGNYKSVVLNEGAEQTLLTWALSTTLLNAARGQYFGVFMRRSGIDPTAQYRLKILDGTLVVWSGKLATIENGYMAINQLDVAQLPPWLPGKSAARALTLVLSGAKNSAGTLSVSIDYLMLMAVDGYRRFDKVGVGMAINRRLIDDPVDGVYTDNGAGGLLSGDFAAQGGGVWLRPKVAQRLYYLMHGALIGDGPIAWGLKVAVKYRPRRLRL